MDGRRPAPPVLLVAGRDVRQVQLFNDVGNEVGQMVLRQPLLQRRRQARAAACHTNIRPHSDQFRVLGSTESVSARDNTRPNPNPYGNGVAIWWLNGPRVASDYNDFYDGSWSNSKPTKNERGNEKTFMLLEGNAVTSSIHVWTARTPTEMTRQTAS